MKFGKSLSNQIEETLPEWRDKFLSYKELKKALKLVGGGGDRPAKKARIAGGSYDVRGEVMTLEEAAFMELLEKELEKFNWFFTDKEEGYIIKQKVLQDQAARAVEEDSREELMKVWKEIVDFHGEMVLLENYSALNYTGLVKILKKYDKRTGSLIRLPFIQKVLQQPFFTTDILNKLIKECETTLDRLFPNNNEASTPDKETTTSTENPSVPTEPPLIKEGEIPELEEIKFMESLYMKSTKVALKTLKEIRSGSSTVSAFSLPPLGVVEEERVWENNSPVVEQLAK